LAWRKAGVVNKLLLVIICLLLMGVGGPGIVQTAETECPPCDCQFQVRSNPKYLYSGKDIAAFIGYAESAIKGLVEVEKLPAYKVGRSWRARIIDLEAWMDEQTVKYLSGGGE